MNDEQKRKLVKTLNGLRDMGLSFKDIVEELEGKPKRWRAEKGGVYSFVVGSGEVSRDNEEGWDCDNEKYNSGNYFKTEADAKNSLIYKVLNSKYDYWIPGMEMEKPVKTPEGAEFYVSGVGWESHEHNPDIWVSCVVRWPREVSK